MVVTSNMITTRWSGADTTTFIGFYPEEAILSGNGQRFLAKSGTDMAVCDVSGIVESIWTGADSLSLMGINHSGTVIAYFTYTAT